MDRSLALLDTAVPGLLLSLMAGAYEPKDGSF
jgi:hypothetical protein